MLSESVLLKIRRFIRKVTTQELLCEQRFLSFMVFSVHEVTRDASQTTWLRSDANNLVNAKRHAREKRRVPRIRLHAKITSHCVPQPLSTRFNMWRIITVMYETNEIPHYSLSLFLSRENSFTIFMSWTGFSFLKQGAKITVYGLLVR